MTITELFLIWTKWHHSGLVGTLHCMGRGLLAKTLQFTSHWICTCSISFTFAQTWGSHLNHNLLSLSLGLVWWLIHCKGQKYLFILSNDSIFYFQPNTKFKYSNVPISSTLREENATPYIKIYFVFSNPKTFTYHIYLKSSFRHMSQYL